MYANLLSNTFCNFCCNLHCNIQFIQYQSADFHFFRQAMVGPGSSWAPQRASPGTGALLALLEQLSPAPVKPAGPPNMSRRGGVSTRFLWEDHRGCAGFYTVFKCF